MTLDTGRASKRRTDRNPHGKHVVFVSYNGLLDPLGPSQILPYLERLRVDWPVHIVSFERLERLADTAALAQMTERLSAQAIHWVRLRYHKWPSLPATTFDLAMGVLTLRRLFHEHDVGLVHARGYVPMAIATRATSSVPVLFDIRGLQAEEYVDGGVWKKGELKWRLAKHSEKKFFRRAAGAVVLTENIRPYVLDQLARAQHAVPLEVIPCCVDLARFQRSNEARKRRRAELGVDDQTLLFIYSGSIGTWYLPDEMARLVRIFRDATGRSVCLLWMVNNDATRAKQASKAAGLPDESVRILSATPRDVPEYLSAADAALALIKPSFSKRSSSPTKYAEYLAMGLPVVISRDVGDSCRIAERRGGVAIEGTFDDESLRVAATELAELMREPREHFRRVATELFDIERVALPIYRCLYERLVQ